MSRILTMYYFYIFVIEEDKFIIITFVLMRRVVVTGMGMVSPIGHDLPSSWNALLSG